MVVGLLRAVAHRNVGRLELTREFLFHNLYKKPCGFLSNDDMLAPIEHFPGSWAISLAAALATIRLANLLLLLGIPDDREHPFRRIVNADSDLS